MDTIVMLCPLRKAYGLLYIIMDRLYIPIMAHYTASINCCKKTFHCNKITEFDIIETKISSADENCGLDDVFPPHDLCSRPETLLIYILILLCILYTSSGYRTYIYIHRDCRPVSVFMKLLPITVSRNVLGSARFLCWMSLVVFFGFTNCVLLYDK